MNNQPKNKPKVQQEENLFMQLLGRYITYWPLFAFLIVVFGTGAFVYLRYATPKYEANATLIIKDQKKGTDDSKAMESMNLINTNKIIENEIEVLQSRKIMESVVRNLHLYAPVFQEGKIRNISGYNISPINIMAADPDSIKSAKKIPLKYNAATGDISINNRKSGKINEWINTPYGRLQFVPNERFRPSNDKKPFYFSLYSVNDMTKIALRDLSVSAVNKLSSIISLAYRDEVPERAEDVLKEVIKMYERASIDEKNSLAKNTLDFVNQRLGIVSQDLDSIERTVQSYKAQTSASDISTQGQLYLQNVSANDQELGRINMQLAVLGQVNEALSNGTASGTMMASTMGINDPALNQLMSDLNAKELEYARLRKTIAENNPMMLSLKEQIERIKPSITRNLESQKKNLEASRDNLISTNDKYSSALTTIPEKEKDLLEISRDQNTKSGIYSFLLKKKEESELSYASTLSDSRVINNPMAGKSPVSPNKMFIYLGAIAVAIVLALLFIAIREGLSRNILYRKDLESMTSIPVIGEIAHNESKEAIVIEAGKRSFIAEEFRKIRVSLHFLGIDKTKKKILITSSIPGEGKSFIAANLAISNALTGKKVLLIDVDLHKPGLGKHFNKSTEDLGLSDYLAGKINLDRIIHKVPGYESLYYISSGTLHESPSELLLNEKINELVANLEHSYDLMVLDTAPSVLITDAYILTQLCDATLYVVRHKYTPKMILKRLDESMEVNPLHNPGIIFNGVKKRGFFKNNYGYGYDYVYGKDYYGNTTKQKKS